MDELPPLDPKCTFTVKNLAPGFPCFATTSHCATSGLRDAVQAAFVGSMRPGLNFSVGPAKTSVASSEVPALGLYSRTRDGL